MAEPTEDVPYEISDHAVADDDTNSDESESLVNDEIIKDIEKYLDEAIAEHNSLDVIDLTLKKQTDITPEQQIAFHKLVVQHLRNVKDVITNKVKEQ